MKKGLALFSLLAMMIWGAGDAHALRAYVAEGPDVCKSCSSSAKPSNTARVGSFDLAGIAADQKTGNSCSIGRCDREDQGCTRTSASCPVLGAAAIVVNPVAAVLNDAALLLMMPYQKSEPLN